MSKKEKKGWTGGKVEQKGKGKDGQEERLSERKRKDGQEERVRER